MPSLDWSQCPVETPSWVPKIDDLMSPMFAGHTLDIQLGWNDRRFPERGE